MRSLRFTVSAGGLSKNSRMTDSAPAVYERALEDVRARLAAAPDSLSAHADAGSLLLALGRPHEALPHLARAAAATAARPETLNNYGAALRTLGRGSEARAYFERALDAAPHYAEARYNLAGLLTKAGDHDRAIPHYETLAAARPGDADVGRALARALRAADRHPEALHIYERLIALHTDASLWADYGVALAESGRFDDAVAAFRRAIQSAPESGLAYRYLADTRSAAVTDADIAALEQIADGESAAADDRIEAGFALAKVFAARGAHERSFRRLSAANAARRRSIAYDECATLAAFDHIARAFSRQFIEARGGGDPSGVPVFVFGMPRSGTTLIEQILAGHPGVFAAGERSSFEAATNGVLALRGPLTMERMLAVTPDELREIGRRYVAELRERAPDALRITDKMPANIRYAGLIRMALPRARMIYAQRDLVDTCVSCFSQHFAGEQPWAYDLAELGRYARAHERLAEHWRAVLPPEALLTVRYDDVVDDLDGQARRLVAFCGLPWNDACARFYETERPVRTASAAQVRRPIYRTSRDRRATYGALLDPLLAALGESGGAFDVAPL